jgi:hypothetical protein
VDSNGLQPPFTCSVYILIGFILEGTKEVALETSG